MSSSCVSRRTRIPRNRTAPPGRRTGRFPASTPYFDEPQLGSADEAIVKEHLPPGAGRRVVIAGHTHAARHVRLDAHRMYVNTGTWTELIPWPPLGSDDEVRAFDDEVRAFIDELEQGRGPLLRRLTWALVDEGGAQLRRGARDHGVRPAPARQ